VVAKLPVEGEGSVGAALQMMAGAELQRLNTAMQQNQPLAVVLGLKLIAEMYKNLNIVSPTLEAAGVIIRDQHDRSNVTRGPTEHPCWAVSQQVWAGITACIAQFATERKIIEAAVSCIKNLFVNLNMHAEPLLSDAVTQIIGLYQAHQHPGCLYVAGKIIEVFGRKAEYAEGFYQMLEALSTPTFAILSAGPDAIRDNPDLTEDYCRLGQQIMLCNPRMYLQTALGPAAFQCGMQALVTAQRDMQERATSFMKPLVGCWRATAEPEQSKGSACAVALILSFSMCVEAPVSPPHRNS